MAEKTTVPVKQEKAVSRWDPFARLQELQDEVARLWGEPWPFALRPFTTPTLRLPATPSTYMPRMDVYEKEGNLVIKADLPGAKPEDVEVTVEDGDLVIKGERKAEKEVNEKDYYRMERSYGSFYRRQPLPEGTKPEQIRATFAHGVLEVTAPKPVEKKPEAQKIPISTK
jgi:HSP20 family protein